MSEARTYYLVLHRQDRGSGAIAALKSVLTKENADIILQDTGFPVVTRKEDGKKYQITSKKMFEYENTDQSKTLFIICGCKILK